MSWRVLNSHHALWLLYYLAIISLENVPLRSIAFSAFLLLAQITFYNKKTKKSKAEDSLKRRESISIQGSSQKIREPIFLACKTK